MENEIFEIGLLEPSQWQEHASTLDRAQARLLIAIIKEALNCLRGTGGTSREKGGSTACPQQRRLYREARAWFLDKDTTSCFSFINIATRLNIEHRRVAREIEERFPDLPPLERKNRARR